jgi:type 1 glutamine amidotransferase
MKTNILPLLALLWVSNQGAWAQHPVLNDAEGRAKIEKSIPTQTMAAPHKPRRLLIFDLNVNYGGHGSISYANYAFKLMGEKTGAWSTEISRDPRMFERENLSRFDAVFFNNTVGNLFEDKELRNNLAEFVYRGGGLMGVHGTSVAFTRWPGAVEDWPEFGVMIGGRGANHKDSEEPVHIKIDDPESAINGCFGGKGFQYRDEFFRVHEPYSRQQLRILLSMDTDKFDPNQGQPRGNCHRPDNDYAVAWIRGYGRGRVFYCTIAHNPYVFWDSTMLKFYQGAIQFALGDLEVPVTPSAGLTPAVRAQEKWGWRLGLEAPSKLTFFESADLASKLGLSYVCGRIGQKISPENPKSLGSDLSSEELQQIRLYLNAAGVRCLGLEVDSFPEASAERQRLFEFSRRMGVEILRCAPAPQTLEAISALCDQFDIQLALTGTGAQEPASYGSLEAIRKYCQGRTPRMGAGVDVTRWARSGQDPTQAARTLQSRLTYAGLGDSTEAANSSNTDARNDGKVQSFFRAIKLFGLKPGMIGIQCESPEGKSRALKNIDLVNGILRE